LNILVLSPPFLFVVVFNLSPCAATDHLPVFVEGGWSVAKKHKAAAIASIILAT
jgi:hypothetical protein